MPFSAEGQRILREFREIFGRNSARLKKEKDREYLVFDPLFLNDRPNEWVALPVPKIAKLGMDVLLLMIRNLGEETMCAQSRGLAEWRAPAAPEPVFRDPGQARFIM